VFPEFETYLPPMLGKTVKCAEGRLNRALEEAGLEVSRKHVMVMKILSYSGPRPQSELAFVTDRDKASLARLIDTMERRQLVERTPSESDRRVNLVGLTEQGKALLAQTDPVLMAVFDELQAGITPEDKETVLRVLHIMRQNALREGVECLVQMKAEK
jgi:DNA-binding MarR family transcriptional regulator